MRMKGGEEACGGHTSVYQADPTCMPNEAERKEYIQDDFIKLYAGTFGCEKGRP